MLFTYLQTTTFDPFSNNVILLDVVKIYQKRNNRAAIAEAQLESIVIVSQETKLLEQKLTKLLAQILSRNPNAKKELLQIQKLLNEHTKLGLKINSKKK